MRQEQKRSFSEPHLTVASINIEGTGRNKQEILGQMCLSSNCDVICIQETHKGLNTNRPYIPGMRLAIEVPHEDYGSAIFVKPEKVVSSTHSTNVNNIEILTVEVGSFTITSIYKPPRAEFSFKAPKNFNAQNNRIILGDFNSHSIQWGYRETDHSGQLVEMWADTNNLSLILDPKLPPSFQSKIWKRGTNPDLCFARNELQAGCTKMVFDPIPKTQHRPVGICVHSIIKTQTIPMRRRFNFRKANWTQYSINMDTAVAQLDPIPENYEQFVKLVRFVSRQTIPRGCRQQYISGLSDESKDQLKKYTEAYENDPFSEDTLEHGTVLLQQLSEARQRKWVETLEKMDMTHSSKIAWNLIKRLNADPKERKQFTNVTADQVAHQLLLNGKTETKHKAKKLNRDVENEVGLLSAPFAMKELNEAINSLKNGKAAGIDDMCPEQIKHFGNTTKTWLLKLFNTSCIKCQIPRSWRKAKVIALLKPGKDPETPSSYRPISLMCHLFKLYERLILKRIENHVDQRLIRQQGGFRPGRSCTGQVLALTEHIENGFEQKLITGVIFVDLTAAYDTVNHKKLISKVYNTTKDFHLSKCIQSILQNRRFYVSLEDRKSRWRAQKNGLPQGSVLAPMLFNMYTNDQPTPSSTEHFLYADDLAIAAQARTFQEVENKLQQTLTKISEYYMQNCLKPNPAKTQVCAFHLHNRSARRKLKITWDDEALEHSEHPKYLGVTLDRSLTYKNHCQKTRQKVSARNHLLKKLAGSKWGANPRVLRTTAQAMCFSTGEYACPVWNRSTHAKSVDIALNETCRLTTGCMKPTPLDKLYRASGFAAPSTRRREAEYTEKFKQTFDSRHPLFAAYEPKRRLKSRKSLLGTIDIEPPSDYPSKQDPTPGQHLNWKTWKTLNRMRTGVAPVKSNLIKWGIKDVNDQLCECGTVQTMEHLTACPNCPYTCTPDDLWLAKQNAIDVAQYWAERF